MLPTLNDFLGSPMCEKGSDFMEEGNGGKQLQKGENILLVVCFKGKKGQMDAATSKSPFDFEL